MLLVQFTQLKDIKMQDPLVGPAFWENPSHSQILTPSYNFVLTLKVILTRTHHWIDYVLLNVVWIRVKYYMLLMSGMRGAHLGQTH